MATILDDPWVVPFQNCVRQRRPVSKMVAITKNRNFFKWPKLLFSIFSNGGHLGYRTALTDTILKGDQVRIISDFDRLCKLEKRGEEIKKKSSLKLLSQSQPHFAEMILTWSPFKIVSVSAHLSKVWLRLAQ
jgi:hypothetical protein